MLEKEDTIFKSIVISLGLCSVLLTKQIGMCLCLMIAVFYILYEQIIYKRKLSDTKYWLSLIFILVLPLSLFAFWEKNIFLLNNLSQFNLNRIDFKEYLDIALHNKGIQYKLDGFRLFKKYLFTEPIIIKPIKIGYVYCYILVMIMLFGVYLIDKKEFNLKKFFLTAFIFTCGTIGYAFTMSVLYMSSSFSEDEVNRLACFGRYMSTYVLIEVLFIVILAIYLLRNKKYYSKLIVVVFGILVLGVNSNLKVLLPNNTKNTYLEIREMVDIINENTAENSKILVVMKDETYRTLLQYLINERPLFDKYYIYDKMMSYEKAKMDEYIFAEDYVYVGDREKKFMDLYEENFVDEVKDKTLYKIDKENKTFSLVD